MYFLKMGESKAEGDCELKTSTVHISDMQMASSVCPCLLFVCLPLFVSVLYYQTSMFMLGSDDTTVNRVHFYF